MTDTAGFRGLREDVCVAAMLFLACATVATAQPQRGRGAAPAGPPPTPKSQAPAGTLLDLTGYWISIVNEDWRYRMVTAPKGDHPGVPLNPEGNRVANAWDAAKDEAASEQCRAYGAAGVMRLPGRIHITWESDNTLKVDTEAGTQTRMFTFGPPPAASAPTWQGVSEAGWEFAGRGRGRGGPAPQYGDLKVVTTHMKPGYLQKNGVPYSENAVLTEYFSRANESNGDSWLVLTHIVEDPQYLNGQFIRSTHYKKLPDSAAAQWSPEPCTAR
jgi:hypothetical protein